MRLCSITFALSSRTKMQTGCFDTDDGEPLIPMSPLSCISALYPPHKSTQLIDRNSPFYSTSPASLTCLGHGTRTFETRGCARTRRKHDRRIPFLWSVTSSSLSLKSLTRSGVRDFVSPEHLIDETVRSGSTVLTPNDIRKESSRYRLSKPIKHLRDKFDSIGKENRLNTESERDSDIDSISWRVVNEKQRKSKDNTTTGKIMAALLIGSIQNMPLTIIDSINPVSASPSNEYIEMKDLTRKIYSDENSQENTDITDSDKEQRRNGLSSFDETEHSSSYENDNSMSNLSNDTSYKILDDSRYSLNKDSDQAEDSSSLQEKMHITPSSMESCMDFMLQTDSGVTTDHLSNLNSTSTKDYIGKLRKDAVIPIITVDVHKSDNSTDVFGMLSDNRRKSVILTSCKMPRTDILILKSTYSPADKGTINDAKQFGFSGEYQTSNRDTNKGYNNVTLESDNLSREVHRVHLTRHERDLCRTRSQSAQRNRQTIKENHIGRKKTDSIIEGSLDSPCTTIDTNVMNEEFCVRARNERRKCMRDLIKLIDTKMIVSTHPMRHVKRTVSKRRKRERKTYKLLTPKKLTEKFSSHIFIRSPTSYKHRGKEASLRVPRVHSQPDSIFPDQFYSTSSFHTTSRSCGSSLVNLTDHYTHVSLSSKRVVISPALTIDCPSDSDSVRNSRRSPKSNCSKLDIVSAVSIDKPSIDTNHPTSPCDLTSKVVAIRKCSSVCNLEKTSSHIDCIKLSTNTANMTYNSCVSRPFPNLRQQDEASISPSYPLPAVSSMAVKMSQSPATRTLANVPLHRRSSDSDLSVTPKGKFSRPFIRSYVNINVNINVNVNKIIIII